EVVVHQRGVHPGGTCDRPDGGLGETPVGEQLPRGGQDRRLCPRVSGAPAGASCHISTLAALLRPTGAAGSGHRAPAPRPPRPGRCPRPATSIWSLRCGYPLPAVPPPSRSAVAPC